MPRLILALTCLIITGASLSACSTYGDGYGYPGYGAYGPQGPYGPYGPYGGGYRRGGDDDDDDFVSSSGPS